MNIIIRNLAISAALCAVLWLASFIISPLLSILIILCATPLVVATLRYGLKAGLFTIPAIFIFGLLITLHDIKTGFILISIFTFLIALPSIWLCRLIMLSKPAVNEGKPDRIFWYPLGRILIWCGAIPIIANILFLWYYVPSGQDSIIFLQSEFESFLRSNELQTMIAEFKAAGADFPLEFTEEKIKETARTLALLLPISFVFWVMTTLFTNFMLGGYFAKKLDMVQRPHWKFEELNLPNSTAIFLILSIICANILSGLPMLTAVMISFALSIAWMLQGLAVVFALFPTGVLRTPFLTLVFFLLLFPPMMVLLIILGVLDAIFDLRSRIEQK